MHYLCAILVQSQHAWSAHNSDNDHAGDGADTSAIMLYIS